MGSHIGRSRSLYHGTRLDNLESIKQNGLSPDVGDFVNDAYGDVEGYFDGPDAEGAAHQWREENLQPLTFMADKRSLNSALTAIRHHVSDKLGKDFHQVDENDLRNHGLLVKLPGEEGYPADSTGLEFNDEMSEHPYTVEPEDWYSDQPVGPQGLQYIHGPALLRTLKSNGLLPLQNPTGLQPPLPTPRNPSQQQLLDSREYYDLAAAEGSLGSHWSADEDSPYPCPRCKGKLDLIYDPAKTWEPQFSCPGCGFKQSVPGETRAIGTPYTDAERNQMWQDVTTSPNRDPTFINPQNWDFGPTRLGSVDKLSLPPEQQAIYGRGDDYSGQRRAQEALERNPVQGTHIWRGEVRNDFSGPPEAVGMHWTVSPDVILKHEDPGRYMPGGRNVVWQGVMDSPEQAIPRSHPIFRGRSQPMSWEGEVRLKPGPFRLNGAYTWEGEGKPGTFWPLGEHHDPGWQYHPLDHTTQIAHQPLENGINYDRFNLSDASSPWARNSRAETDWSLLPSSA